MNGSIIDGEFVPGRFENGIFIPERYERGTGNLLVMAERFPKVRHYYASDWDLTPPRIRRTKRLCTLIIFPKP